MGSLGFGVCRESSRLPWSRSRLARQYWSSWACGHLLQEQSLPLSNCGTSSLWEIRGFIFWRGLLAVLWHCWDRAHGLSTVIFSGANASTFANEIKVQRNLRLLS